MKTFKRLWAWLKNYDAGLYCLALSIALVGCGLFEHDDPQTEFSRVYHVDEMPQIFTAMVRNGDTIATRDAFLFVFRTGKPPRDGRAFVIDSAMKETEVLCRTFEADSAKLGVMLSDFRAVPRAMWVRLIWRVVLTK